LHLKSVDPEKQAWVAREQIPFAIAVANDMFCEPSQGVVDFTAFCDALAAAGYDGFATVEQDMYPAPFDKPLPIAQRTRVYLKELGIG
jgi:inosose dehydratase